MISKYFKTAGLMLLGITAASLTSCQNDDFGEGMANLQLNMQVNTTLKRSNPDNLQELRDGCTIYLSSAKGLIYKFHGVDNLPASIPLKSGPYVAEAWTGDSVSASFDKKFYRGYEPFELTTGDTKQVTINCHIANVVASVAPQASVADVLSEYTVTVSHSRGSLDFTSDMDATVRGFFMMPNEDNDLKWVLEGKDLAGTPVYKEGIIEGVQRAHEYVINLSYTPGAVEAIGGGLITVTIDDRCLLVEDVVTITGAPQIKGVGYELDNGLSAEPGKWERHSIYVEAFGTLQSLAVHAPQATAMGLPATDFDFMKMNAEQKQQFSAAGLTFEYAVNDDRCSARLFLEAAMLNKLPDGDYQLQLTAQDSNGKKRVRTLTLQVSDADVKLTATPWQEIYATKATLHGELTKDTAQDPGFRYRKLGTAQWTTVSGTLSGNSYSATITGLSAGTTYEYQALSASKVNTSTQQFTTESIFTIPNAGFEDWSNYEGNSKVLMPSASGKKEFWDSGNHGSATMSVNVTSNSSAVKHSGAYSALLKSQFVGIGSIGAFAAGNLFAGTYDKTDGTNGELTFGRPFNGSRPVKLAGYCYYKPAAVTDTKTDKIAKGDMDQGIIYVALTTGTSKIFTKTSQLFNPNGSDVIAYGEMVFTSEYGSSSEMKRFEITLDYKAAAALQKATHVVLTCSASRYGDYFSGGPSEMYLDDLEFIY